MKSNLAKLALTAALVLATTLTLSCGNHSWEELLGLDSSSSQQDDNYSSSSLKLSSTKASSSSLRQSSSSSEQHSGIIVAPLLQTKWGQGSPYNDLFPLVNGNHAVTGCGTTANVQIMKFHRHPARGKGEGSKVCTTNYCDFVPFTSWDVAYDWDNMLNEYTTANPGTEQQRNAVAVLNYHFVLGREANGSREKALVNNFGYDKSIQYLYRRYYSDAEWEAIIRQQLDLGLPVWYWGHSVANGGEEEDYSTESNHAFVVDGYDNAGKFHINVGWKGSYDGWYSLKDINFGEGRRYNYKNTILINIKPDKGGVPLFAMALDSFSIAKTTVKQNEGFIVNAGINRQNPSPYDGQTGVALVDNKGNIVEVLGSVKLASKYSIPCVVSDNVKPGQYTLRVVTRPTGGEWSIVELYNRDKNVPKSFNITVTAGTETGVKGGGYGLWLGKLESEKASASPNEGFKVSSILRNVSSETFSATAGVALMDYDNNIVAILNTWEISLNANSGTSRTATYKVPSTVPPGQYKLRIVVKTKDNDEWRVATIAEGNIQTFIDFTVL